MTSPKFQYPTIDTIPIHPESIFESIEVTVGRRKIRHTHIEKVMARPSWDFEEAKSRLEPSVRRALKSAKGLML